MPDYEPVNLTPHRNAGMDLFGDASALPTGDVRLRGLPFVIGEAHDGPPFVGLGPGGHLGPLDIAFPWPARTIVVAHLLVDSDVPVGGPVGLPVADYEITLDDGASVTVPIRELFEIGALFRPDPIGEDGPARRVGTASFLAAPDVPDSLRARCGRTLGRRRPPDDGVGSGFPEWLSPVDMAHGGCPPSDRPATHGDRRAVRGRGCHGRRPRRGSDRQDAARAHPDHAA